MHLVLLHSENVIPEAVLSIFEVRHSLEDSCQASRQGVPVFPSHIPRKHVWQSLVCEIKRYSGE